MKKYKVTVYQMGAQAVEKIIESVPPYLIDTKNTIYFYSDLKDKNDNYELIAMFPAKITSVELIED